MRLRTTATAALLAATAACSLVTDADQFKEAPGSQVAPGGNRHLKLRVTGFTSHVAGFFEFRVIDANNFLRMRGVADPLGGGTGDATFFVLNGFPPASQGPFRVDLFGDKNDNRLFDGPGNPDHSWRIENITGDTVAGANPNDATWEIEQIHNQSWQDFPATRDTGLAAKVRFANMGAYLGEGGGPGRTLEVRIADAASQNAVGFYRMEAIKSAAFEVALPGVVEDRVAYDVYVWVDANANGAYDNPARGGDHGWKVPATATSTGLELPFDPTRAPDKATDLGPRF